MKIKKNAFNEVILSGSNRKNDLEKAQIRRTQALAKDLLFFMLACVISVLILPNTGTAATLNLTESSPGVAISPSVSIGGNDRWVAWLEYTFEGIDNESAAIKAQHFGTSGSVEGPLTVASGRVMTPLALTVDSETAWFFWIEVDTHSSQLRARRREGASWTASVTISTNRAAYPSATLDQNGNPWVAWESYSGTDAEIYVSNWNGTNFTTPALVSQPAVPAYSPVIETDTEGGIWAAWQAKVGSNFEILIRRFMGGLWGDVWQVTAPLDGDGDFLGMHVMPTLSHGTDGKVWVAWVAKGLDVRAPGKPPHLHGWVIDRRIQLCQVQPDGTVSMISQVPVPIDAFADPELDRKNLGPEWPLGTTDVTSQVSVPIETFVDPELDRKYRGPDRPVLLVAHNKVMVYYRLLINDLLRIRPIHWRAWMQFMDQESGLWLSMPFDIAEGGETIGEPDAPAVADTGTGFIAVWQKGAAPDSYPDGFSDPVSDISMNEVLDSVLGAASVPGEALQKYDAPLLLDMPRPRRTISQNGNTYQLFHGTLHSHSVNSNCAHDRDDLLRENYRRARDLVGLDFYSIGDHGHQMSHFDWFFNRIRCDLNEGVRGMTTFLGSEYTNSDYGHQILIHNSCDGRLFSRRSQTTPESLWSALSASHTIAIPHHTAEARDFLDYDLRHFNANFNRLYEIYQARGSYECYDCIGGFPEPWPSADDPFYYNKAPDPANGVGYFQDALAKGMRMGVNASPDHTGMWGITGVYAASGSQDDIFDALTARRTYGVSNAAARMIVDFRSDGHIMGEEYELAEGCPVFSGYVRTDYTNPMTGLPAQIDEIKIYRVTDTAPGENGEVFKIEPGTNEVSFTFHDTACPGSGSAAYYLRAIQTDVYGVDQQRPSVAWTSPIFVTWKSSDFHLYTPVTPCRIVDTRLAGGAIPAWGIRSYNVRGAVDSQGGNPVGCPSPKGEPRAVYINVTVVPQGNGHIVAYPAGSTAPNTSVVNYRRYDQNIANSATIKTCFNCAEDINIQAAFGSAHLVIDVLGYYYSMP